MYKDRNKQKEANRRHAKAYRDRKKGMTEGMTESIIPVTPSVIPDVIPKPSWKEAKERQMADFLKRYQK